MVLAQSAPAPPRPKHVALTSPPVFRGEGIHQLGMAVAACQLASNGGGTNTWDTGVLTGADGNKLTVSGTQRWIR